MSTLATLYAYADQLRLIPILYQDQVDALTTFFPNVRGFADTLEEAYCDPCDLPWEGFADFLRKPLKTKASYERGRAFAMISYHQNPTAYKHYLPTFRKMLFKLDNDYVNRGLIALASAAGDIPIVNNPKLVLIGVHVRRTDYAASTANHGGTLAPARYYEKAMDHFRKRYGWGGRRKMMFVVVSDDMAWCRANLGGADDVYLLGSHEEGVSEVEQTENLGFDLGLMLNCHHVIVSHGTLVRSSGGVLHRQAISSLHLVSGHVAGDACRRRHGDGGRHGDERTVGRSPNDPGGQTRKMDLHGLQLGLPYEVVF